jgi:hypothetical protein
LHRCRFSSQNQKRRLKGFLGIMNVSKYPPTDSQYQGPMTLDDRGERGLITISDKPTQQLGISSAG